MCGITACLGEDSFIYCLKSLLQLQNRGYDSAGICSIIDRSFKNTKYASTNNETSLQIIEKHQHLHDNSNISIGHTRWATHGPKTDINAHPHICSKQLFSVVHNGIIENFEELKDFLEMKGFNFKSQTDTEVIVNLISYYFQECQDVAISIKKAIVKLEGTWGLCIIYLLEPHKIYATRHGSPLLVGHNNTHAFICSEQIAFCGLVNNYIVLRNNDLCLIETTSQGIVSISTNEQYKQQMINHQNLELTPSPFPHWTIKEIHEQVDSSLRAISFGGRLISKSEVRLGGLESHKQILLDIDNLIVLGCGTSYHSGMIGVNYFKELCDFNSVQIFDGAEFGYSDIPNYGNTGLILISQSGETKDLHRCLEISKKKDLVTIGIINVVDSLIAREVDCGCYLNAGREVGVASTKSFTNQVILLNMVSIWFAQNKNINQNLRIKYIENLHNLHQDIQKTIQNSLKQIPSLLSLFGHSSCFLLGKHSGEAIAREGALKVKEISYIHAEGYNTSSLKHGPFALLTSDFPVIIISPEDEYWSKNENAYQEILSRGSPIIYITDNENINSERPHVITISQNSGFKDLLSIIPIQILAYQLSISRGINPDMPRNLAKVVTVE